MLNPPPADPVIQGVGQGALSPTFKVNRVELYSSESNEENDLELILKSSFQEAIQDDYSTTGEVESSWYNNPEYAENLKLRIVLTCDPQVAKRLDYLQQRFNEYTAGIMGPINPDSGNLLNVLLQRYAINGTRDRILQQLVAPMGPFDAGSLSEYFTNQQSSFYYYDLDPDFRNLKQTLVYEVAAADVLERDRNGNIKRTLSNKSVTTSDNRTFHQLQEIASSPIKIDLSAQNGIFSRVKDIGMSQLSIYAFSYFDFEGYQRVPNPRRMREPDAVLPTLETGMGYVSPTVCLGQYTRYESQDSEIFVSEGINTVIRDREPGERTSLLMGMVGPQELAAPNASSLEDFRQETLAAIQNLPRRILENIGEQTDRSYVGGKRKVLIGDTAYVTPLWISKDTEEDFRYIFGFSLRSYLINNSKFPWLYQNKKSATDLIVGVDNGIEQTEILNYELYRSLMEFDQFGNTNKLATNLKSVEKDLGTNNPDKRLKQPAQIRNLFFQQDDVPDILFFEGVDNLKEEKDSQRISKFQYRVNFCVKDAAENYIRTHIDLLSDSAKTVSKIYGMIVNSPEDFNIIEMDGAPTSSGVNLFDYNSMTIKVPLGLIIVDQSRDNPVTADTVVTNAVNFYCNSLENFGVVSAEQKQGIITQLQTLANSNNPDGLKMVSDAIDNFSSILLGILGDSKLRFVGDGSEKKKQKLENKGLFDGAYSILETEHIFSELPITGLTFQSGYEIVRQTRENSDFYGLMRIPRNRFIDRTLEEFGKYFYAAKEGLPIDDLAYSRQYADSTTAYLTPEVIRTAGKNPINQIDFRVRNTISTRYDLDRYGELFVDLSKINKKSEFLNGTYYILQNETAGINQNKQLFNSLSSELQDQHSFYLEFDGELELPSLDTPAVQGGFQVDLDFIRRRSLIGQIFGGNTDLSPSATSWQNETNTATRNSYPQQTPKEQDPPPNNEQEGLPIKFMFSVFGELQTNSMLASTPRYMEDMFNSMKKVALSLGVSEGNVLDRVENDLSFIPNQLKSMLIAASSENNQLIAGQFDAVRNLIVDQEVPLTRQVSTSTLLDAPELPYDLTYDSMKIYSKMLAYWMNYKEIFVIEYLSGFEKTSKDLLSNQADKLVRGQLVDNSLQASEVIATNPYTPNPLYFKWEKLTSSKLRDSDNRNLLCRIRTINADDFVTSQENLQKDLYSGRPEIFDLPVYNQYFILGSSPPKTRPPLNQEPPPQLPETTAPTTPQEISVAGVQVYNLSPASVDIPSEVVPGRITVDRNIGRGPRY